MNRLVGALHLKFWAHHAGTLSSKQLWIAKPLLALRYYARRSRSCFVESLPERLYHEADGVSSSRFALSCIRALKTEVTAKSTETR